jgi:hypothetical protein
VLPVGRSHGAVVLAGPRKFRLLRVFGRPPNNEIEVQHSMAVDQPHVFEVHVRPTDFHAEITIKLDGTDVIAWKGPLHALSPRRDFAIVGFRTTTLFSSVEMREGILP